MKAFFISGVAEKMMSSISSELPFLPDRKSLSTSTARKAPGPSLLKARTIEHTPHHSTIECTIGQYYWIKLTVLLDGSISGRYAVLVDTGDPFHPLKDVLQKNPLSPRLSQRRISHERQSER